MSESLPKPPRKGKEFKKYWYLNIENVMKRDNYNEGYLKNLEILCVLYTDFDKFVEILDEEGYTYEVDSRNGHQIKPHPLMGEKSRTVTSIISYSKLLGLLLTKDKDIADKKEDEWT